MHAHSLTHSLTHKISGCSAVRLAYLLWEQGVAGSNPATPTNKKRPDADRRSGFLLDKRASKTCFCKRLKYNKKKPTAGRSFLFVNSPNQDHRPKGGNLLPRQMKKDQSPKAIWSFLFSGSVVSLLA